MACLTRAMEACWGFSIFSHVLERPARARLQAISSSPKRQTCLNILVPSPRCSTDCKPSPLATSQISHAGFARP
jgi:hypothetical protein